MTLDERGLYVKCLWREARGEGIYGMAAVAWVIWNRHIQWKVPLRRVILSPNQFTGMTDEDDTPRDLQYQQAEEIVDNILAGQSEDPTHGALYYYNPRIADSGWFVRNVVDDPQRHPQTAVLGNHIFYA